jgi:hypothetical protein
MSSDHGRAHPSAEAPRNPEETAMRAWIIASLLVAVSHQATASRAAPVWDRSNTLTCTVVAAEICRYPGGNRTCAPAQASFDGVKIDYGKSQVNLLAAGNLLEGWAIFGLTRGLRQGAEVQFLHLRFGTRSTDAVLHQSGLLRFEFQRPGGNLAVEARCRPH